MKTKIQKQIYNETQNMSVDELLRYFNGKTKTKAAKDAKFLSAIVSYCQPATSPTQNPTSNFFL
jgi:hypothetical protein